MNRPFVFRVEAEIADKEGHTDAAYSLCDSFTIDELLAALRDRLQERVKEQLACGQEGGVGHVLRIAIYDELDWEHIK